MSALAHTLARTSALALVAGVLALGTSVAPSPAHAAPTAPAAPAAPATDPGHGASAKAQLAAAEAADPGEISGTIQDAQANPIDGVTVQADEQVTDENGDPSWNLDRYESYSSDGSYAITLPAGTWRLSFLPDDSESYDGVTTPTFTLPGADLADPIVLPSAGHQTVSGTVVGTGGGGIAGATVSLYWLHGEPGAWTESENVDQTTTDADGGYTFPGVRTHRFYAVEVSATGYHPVVGGTAGDDPLAAPGVEVTGDTTLDPIALSPASTLSGTVSGPSGPDPNAEVELYRWYDDGDGETGWVDVADVGVDGEGHYAFASLDDAATYTLHVVANDEDLNDAWLGGGLSEPSTPTAANSFETSGIAALVQDVTLTRAAVVTGTVTDQDGQPLAGAAIVAYAWNGSTWEQRTTDTTADDGTFSFRSPAGSTATFRASQHGYQTTFYGGGTALPAAPSATNSFAVPDAGASTGTLALPPFHSALGTVAGQDLAYCRSNTLAANDDESSDAVDLPFPLKFFGTPYTQLWVNNNGNVTFNGPLSTYTPEDISSDTGLPIIAPFFADVDTEGAGSQLVSYGTSPDGDSLCVNWADVGYYSAHDDLLNTFQLILTKDDAGAGRSAGDFDITFNYDQVSWETGDASEGTNGIGGTSALAGFSAGTGAPGTFVVLPGSLHNGALLDGGPDALVAGKQASQQTGRYVFQVLNQGQTSALGGLSGTVTKASDHTGIGGAYVQACTAAGGCSYTDTGADGGYSFSALLQGAYAITVWPPDDSLFSGGTSASVTGGQTTTGADVALAAPQPMPPNVALSNNGISGGGVPSVYYGDPTTFTMTGCAGVANPTYTVTLVDGTPVAHGALTESPAGTYSATIPPFYPQHGDAVFTTNVPNRCGGAGTTFNLYIDPSGVVTDQYGRPIADATVTLSRSDTSTGTFTDVPDGSDLMSASNRRNPDTTDDRGQFAWEVEAGWYEVAATAPGCDPASTPAMQVPPAQIDLALKLTCAVDAPRPTAAPTITGTPRAGQTLQVAPATWAAPIATTGTTLMRRLGSGPATRVALRNGRYTLTAGDVGATFYATSTGRRPDVIPPEFAAGAVSFNQVSAESRHVVVTAAGGHTGNAHPSKPVTSTVKLTVKPKRPHHSKKAKILVRISAPTGLTGLTGTVRLYDGTKAIGKAITLTGGRTVAKVKLKVRLKKGKHHLRAVFAGSSTVAAGTSPVDNVKVR